MPTSVGTSKLRDLKLVEELVPDLSLVARSPQPAVRASGGRTRELRKAADALGLQQAPRDVRKLKGRSRHWDFSWSQTYRAKAGCRFGRWQ